jgi:hypothetical protein
VLRKWWVVLCTHRVLCVGATGVLCVANGVPYMSCQMPNVHARCQMFRTVLASCCGGCVGVGTSVFVAWVVVGLLYGGH